PACPGITRCCDGRMKPLPDQAQLDLGPRQHEKRGQRNRRKTPAGRGRGWRGKRAQPSPVSVRRLALCLRLRLQPFGSGHLSLATENFDVRIPDLRDENIGIGARRIVVFASVVMASDDPIRLVEHSETIRWHDAPSMHLSEKNFAELMHGRWQRKAPPRQRGANKIELAMQGTATSLSGKLLQKFERPAPAARPLNAPSPLTPGAFACSRWIHLDWTKVQSITAAIQVSNMRTSERPTMNELEGNWWHWLVITAMSFVVLAVCCPGCCFSL